MDCVRTHEQYYRSNEASVRRCPVKLQRACLARDSVRTERPDHWRSGPKVGPTCQPQCARVTVIEQSVSVTAGEEPDLSSMVRSTPWVRFSWCAELPIKRTNGSIWLGAYLYPHGPPNKVWRSDETYQGCWYTILVLSTCIVLSEIFGN